MVDGMSKPHLMFSVSAVDEALTGADAEVMGDAAELDFGEDGNRAGFGVENQDRTVAASSDRDDGYCRD